MVTPSLGDSRAALDSPCAAWGERIVQSSQHLAALLMLKLATIRW